MKRLLTIISAAVVLTTLSACSNSVSTQSDKTNSEIESTTAPESSTESTESTESMAEQSSLSSVSTVSSREESRSEHPVSYKIPDAEKPTGKSSSLDAPLGLNEWGSCAKFCTKEGTYINVPIRLVSARRGDSIYGELKETVGSARYLFEPKDNEEYLVCEYEICLDGFPVAEGGTLCDIEGNITGTNGEAIKLSSGSYWGSTLISLDTETYYYDGVIHSLICSPIPKEIKDYLIVLGEYGETQAYFKPA